MQSAQRQNLTPLTSAVKLPFYSHSTGQSLEDPFKTLVVPTEEIVSAILTSCNWNQWGMVDNASGSEGPHIPEGFFD